MFVVVSMAIAAGSVCASYGTHIRQYLLGGDELTSAETEESFDADSKTDVINCATPSVNRSYSEETKASEPLGSDADDDDDESGLWPHHLDDWPHTRFTMELPPLQEESASDAEESANDADERDSLQDGEDSEASDRSAETCESLEDAENDPDQSSRPGSKLCADDYAGANSGAYAEAICVSYAEPSSPPPSSPSSPPRTMAPYLTIPSNNDAKRIYARQLVRAVVRDSTGIKIRISAAPDPDIPPRTRERPAAAPAATEALLQQHYSITGSPADIAPPIASPCTPASIEANAPEAVYPFDDAAVLPPKLLEAAWFLGIASELLGALRAPQVEVRQVEVRQVEVRQVEVRQAHRHAAAISLAALTAAEEPTAEATAAAAALGAIARGAPTRAAAAAAAKLHAAPWATRTARHETWRGQRLECTARGSSRDLYRRLSKEDSLPASPPRANSVPTPQDVWARVGDVWATRAAALEAASGITPPSASPSPSASKKAASAKDSAGPQPCRRCNLTQTRL